MSRATLRRLDYNAKTEALLRMLDHNPRNMRHARRSLVGIIADTEVILTKLMASLLELWLDHLMAVLLNQGSLHVREFRTTLQNRRDTNGEGNMYIHCETTV